MVVILYYSIILILIVDFLFERWLDFLNAKQRSSELPSELKGIYDPDKYQKSVEYERSKHNFATISESFGFIVMLILFVTGGFGFIDGIVRELVNNPIHVALLYFGIFGLLSEILSFPFKWYSTFIIEAKFGFNKTTPRLFLLDQVKGLLIAATVGGLILYPIIWIYLIAGNLFWLYALGVISAFSIFMLLFYSSVIVPIFNKQTPLPEGELKDAITAFCQKAGFLLDNIYVIDGSKRSTKANAYFTGLGSKKRIVIYDTLISELNINQIVAVLAHEIGHYKRKHVYTGLLFSLFSTAVMLYLFALVSSSPAFSEVLGSKVPGFHLAVISFGMLYTPISLVIGVVMNFRSRKNEYEADQFANEFYSSDYLGLALKKLSVSNLSNLNPHSYYVFFHYSHPTLLQRLKRLAEIRSAEHNLE